MKITKAVYRAPDSYGDTSFDVEASVENKKEDIVDIILVRVIMIEKRLLMRKRMKLFLLI